MTLDAAHRGYDYQDLLTAIRMVDLLLGYLEITHVDEKLFEKDIFDDLTVLHADGLRERFQFKHRDAVVALPLDTLTTGRRDLKLDSILTCALADRASAAASGAASLRYRLILRDGAPEPALQPFIRPASPDPGPFSVGFRSSRLQLDPEKCWPSTMPASGPSNPFSFLRTANASRDDFIWLCERLVIEVGAPEASFNPSEPGPAEQVLLDRVRIEIGAETYPNTHRSALDVGRAMIEVAKSARAKRCQATVAEVLARTRLRNDFGAVARAHPVDPGREIARASAVLDLAARAEAAAASRRALVLEGPPGQGKSWMCHQLLAELDGRGWLTVEHYCFLGEADSERGDRVSLERIVGSLLFRLATIDPSIVDEQRPRYAADEQALVQAIERALTRDPTRMIALVIDGLDHVTRVQGTIVGRPDPSHRLAEHLAALELPKGCVLIVLSQPGTHLDPLRCAGAETVSVPPLDEHELLLLATKLGTIASLSDPDPHSAEAGAFASALRDLTKGNALYATYVCHEVRSRPSTTIAPYEVLRRLPSFDGTLQSYYAYLVSGIQQGAVAETLALVDFALTRDDLREIRPADAHRVNAEVARLAPALNEKSAQGGLRIYHESFARFLREQLEQNQGNRHAILAEVAQWLERKGLFADSRAFRFLLPLLEAMGEFARVIAAIDPRFLRSAVANGFPATAMIANISVGLRCAGRVKDWAAMARLVELARAAESFEYERLDDALVEFSDVAIAVVGGRVLAERLLHDGRPTVPPRAGIQLCAELDKHGFAPPWEEYLAALEQELETSNTSYPAEYDQKVDAARLRGLLRRKFPTLDSVPPEPDWSTVASFIEEYTPPPASTIAMLCDVIGLGETLNLMGLIQRPEPYAVLLAECCSRARDMVGRDVALAMATPRPPAGMLPRLFSLGVTLEQLPVAAAEDLPTRLRECAAAVTRDRLDPTAVATWIDLCARAALLEPALSTPALARIRGPGWYHCWLEFVLLVSRAERAAEPDREALAALHILERDLDPFAGALNVHRLYSIRGQISASLRRALALLTDHSWAEGVATLQRVTYALRIRAGGEVAGPIDIDDYLGMLVSLTTQARRPTTEAAIGHSMERADRLGYSQIASFHLFYARCALCCGDTAVMIERWRSACELLVAYGWRRDRTVFELLDPLDELIRTDLLRAQRCLAKIQSTCLRVILHTDGKDTRAAFDQWLGVVASADAEAASKLITSDLLGSCNDVHERHEATRVRLWEHHFRSVHPVVAGALRLTIAKPLDRRDPEALQLLVAHLQQHDSPALRRLVRYVSARFDERPTRYSYTDGGEQLTRDDAVVDSINAVLEGTNLPRVVSRQEAHEPTGPDAATARFADPPFAKTERPTDLLAVEDLGRGSLGMARLLRRVRRDVSGSLEADSSSMRHANAFGYRLIEMAQAGQRDEAEIALRALAHEVRYRMEQPILRALAEGLERHGHAHLAAMAHVLCWTRSRGGGGWLTFGGDTELDSLKRAVALDRSATLDEIALEIGGVIGEGRGSLGVTQALVYAFARLDLGNSSAGGLPRNSAETAFAIWDAAEQVISSRTPRIVLRDDPSSIYVPSGSLDRDRIERALALAVVAGLAHPSREQKRRTLLAISLLMELRSTAIEDAIGIALGSLSDPTTLYWLLCVLRSQREAASGTVRAVATALEQLCRSEFLAVRSIARELLESIDHVPGALPAGQVITSLTSGFHMDVDFFAGDRIRAVKHMLPGLLSSLAVSANRRADETRERLERQQRALSTPRDNSPPDAITAELEVFEAELQRLAGAARASLNAIGKRVARPAVWERRLASRLEDSPTLALALERSREPRPQIQIPPAHGDQQHGTLSTGVATDAPTVAFGPFQGFRILAVVEFRKLGDMGDTGRPSRRYLALEIGRSRGANVPPVRSGNAKVWFSPATSSPDPVGGPLIGVDEMLDPRSGLLSHPSYPIATPRPWMLAALGLAPDGSDLIFADAKGVGLGLRTWRSHYQVDDYRLTKPLLVGCQLVLREDLFQQLIAICGSRLVLRDFVLFEDT